MRRSLLIILLCAAALAGGAALLFSPTTGNESKPKDEPRIIAVKRGSVQTRVAETGTLEPALTIDIKSQVSGEVRQLHVSEGDRVAPNQPLAVIRQEPGQARQVAQVRAALEEERVNVEHAKRALTRMETLLQQGFVSSKDVEAAEQDYKRAKVRLELAERQLLLALGGNRELYRRALERQLLSDQPEEFLVLSPSAGTIIELKVHPGEIITSGTATVGGGTVLMSLADLTRMVVKAKINEVNIGRVSIGQPVEVRLDALPGHGFHGTVTAITPRGEKVNGIVTYQVRIEIDNKDQTLRPLMTANVDILTDVLKDVITIPLEALRTEHGDDMVYVMVNGGRLARKVRVGLRTESLAVIVHGLQEGDTVVIPSFSEKPS
ncbi:MAG: efflux RND transporter periplasmic adaptor subunit [Nitrospirae bacterium]|nr:efflux RND transporter periplasmic adaptor subunit [Nitrospirota bacterium]